MLTVNATTRIAHEISARFMSDHRPGATESTDLGPRNPVCASQRRAL
jgi:hypothetical protein